MPNRKNPPHAKKNADPSQADLPDEGFVEILDMAAESFMRRGFDATSIDDIAARLGATKGRIYHHFRSKADLFFEVFSLAMVSRLAGVVAAHRSSGTAAERLSRMVRAHLMSMTENVPYQRVANQGIEMVAQGALTPAQRERLEEIAARQASYEDLFREVMREGVADASLAICDVDLATRMIFGAMNWVSRWYSPPAGEADTTDAGSAEATAERTRITETVAATFMQGLLARPETTAG